MKKTTSEPIFITLDGPPPISPSPHHPSAPLTPVLIPLTPSIPVPLLSTPIPHSVTPPIPPPISAAPPPISAAPPPIPPSVSSPISAPAPIPPSVPAPISAPAPDAITCAGRERGYKSGRSLLRILLPKKNSLLEVLNFFDRGGLVYYKHWYVKDAGPFRANSWLGEIHGPNPGRVHRHIRVSIKKKYIDFSTRSMGQIGVGKAKRRE